MEQLENSKPGLFGFKQQQPAPLLKATAEDVYAKKESATDIQYQLLFPAVKKETIKIEVERNDLTISAVDINGLPRNKTLQLQGDFDPTLTEAELDLGILTLTIPRRSKAPNKFEIKVK